MAGRSADGRPYVLSGGVRTMEREIKNNSSIRAAVTSGMENAIAPLVNVSE